MDPDPPRCDFEATLTTLGRKHVLGILARLGRERPARFSQLRDELGVNPRTLTARLVDLQSLGVVVRRVKRVVPRQVVYDLTPMGLDLVGLFSTLRRWRAKYEPKGRSPTPRDPGRRPRPLG